MKILKFLLTVFLLSVASILHSTDIESPYLINETSYIGKIFTIFRSGSTEKLSQIISPKGIYICRIFNSGNLGGRGKDNCATYKSNEIHSPDGIIAKVPDETPIDILWVFPSSSEIVQDKISDIPIIKAVVTSNQTSPSLLAKELVTIIETFEINLDLTPAIIISNQQVIFIDGQIIDDALVGGVMIIKSNTNGSHSIEAIYDYR